MPRPLPRLHHIRGTVLDADRRTPLRGASVWAGQHEAVTDADGRFALEVPAEATLIVKMPGYEMRRIPAVGPDVAVTLKPKSIRAAYLTYYGIAEPSIRNRVLELVDRTELNAVVIDVKGDRGLIPYRTEVPAALDAGALGPVIIKDFDGMLRSFRERGIYTIARIVAFKDNVLAKHRPDLAVIDTRTGKPGWTTRSSPGSTRSARRCGITSSPSRRKPSPRASTRSSSTTCASPPMAGCPPPPTRSRTPRPRVCPPSRGSWPRRAASWARPGRSWARTSSAIPPSTPMTPTSASAWKSWRRTSTTSVPWSTVRLSPRHPGFRNPVTHPYEIVRESVRLIRQRTQHTAVQVRPWLQDFRDYAFDRRIFGTREIRAQIKGASDGGGVGFMLWNPRNDYTAQALLPKAGTVPTTSRYRDGGRTDDRSIDDGSHTERRGLPTR